MIIQQFSCRCGKFFIFFNKNVITINFLHFSFYIYNTINSHIHTFHTYSYIYISFLNASSVRSTRCIVISVFVLILRSKPQSVKTFLIIQPFREIDDLCSCHVQYFSSSMYLPSPSNLEFDIEIARVSFCC